MLFNSIEFVFFLPSVFVLYWFVCGRSIRFQNILLLLASYLFYGWWDWRYLFLIAACTAVNYWAAFFVMPGSASPMIRRIVLILASSSCLIVLGLFKYYNFFIDNLVSSFSLVGITLNLGTLRLILPVGISFFTFQALSYTIDVYQGKLKPEKNWVAFFTFISFFPQLVAGPIERATNLLPQFQKQRHFIFDNAFHGITLIAYGLFKKIVVADNLALYVNDAFGNYHLYNNSVTAFLGMIFFSFQIYCDFSGYSDVARGVAKLFGFELMVNFDRPYLAQNISDFWRHWHISLSTWFKDYMYIPLGGSRGSSWNWLRNIWIVFLVSGLWHGANWTFIVWGALHALYQTVGWFKQRLIGNAGQEYIKQCSPIVRQIVTLNNIIVVNVLVCFAWVFFRASNCTEACNYIKMILSFKPATNLASLSTGQGPMHLALCLSVIGVLLLTYCFPRDLKMGPKTSFSFITIMIGVILFLGRSGQAEFIYFQF